MSAPLHNSAPGRERREFFANLHEKFPRTKDDRSLRLALLTALEGEEVTTVTTWDADRFRAATQRIKSLDAWDACDLIDRAMKAVPPLPVAYNVERVEKIRAKLLSSRDERIERNWKDADRLAEIYALAIAAGANPSAELAAAAKLIGLKLKAAERWVMASRLVPPEERDEFPDLSWSVIEVAASRWGEDEQPTEEAVRERLELASDNGWSGIGLTRHLAGPKEKDPVHPSRRALEKLCANVSHAAAQEVRQAWPVLDAMFSVRKVAA